MFHVGQRVVCINNGPSRFGKGTCPRTLRKGGIYTVTSCFFHEVNKVPAVLLAEVEPTFGYSAFDAARFAPIKERETNIEIFKEMLVPHREDA